MSHTEPFPVGIHPMLATPGEAFNSTQHIFEIKWDGIRALAYKDNNRFWIETRNLKPALPRFPELRSVSDVLQAKQVILDGEIVVFGDDGQPNFDRVRSRNAQRNPTVISQAQKDWPAVYIAFDCLFRDGKNLMPMPLRTRKEHLSDVTSGIRVTPDDGPNAEIVVPRGIHANGIELLEATVSQGLEGIVAKHLDSSYQPGKRSDDWIKIRNVYTADCVIGGYVPKGDTYFKSLLLGLYDEGELLLYMGNVGTGFRIDEIAAMRQFLDAHLTDEASPFKPSSVTHPPPINWVKPLVVCEVEFLTLTAHRHFRHATFRGLRPDKNPSACTVVSELPPHLSRIVQEAGDILWQPR